MRLGRRGAVALAAAAAGLAVLLALVVFRAPIAEAVAIRVLAWRGVEARFELTRLSLDRGVVEDLSVGSEDIPAVAATRIEARYGLVGLLRGEVRAVTIEGLEAHVSVDEEGARLPGLPSGGSGAGGGGASRPSRVPQVSIPDGRLYVETPAGELVADVAVAGGPDQGWSAQVTGYPAILARGDVALELAAGSVDAAVDGDSLSIEAEIRLASLSRPGARAEDLAATARFSGTYAEPAKLAGLQGQGALELALGEARLDPETAAAWAARLAPQTEGATREAVGAHLDALRDTLTAALASVSADARFNVAVADGAIALTPDGEAALAAPDGARLALAAASGAGGAITVHPLKGAADLAGLSVTARLPDQLDARAILSMGRLARAEGGGARAEAELTLALAPWAAGGLTLAADVQRLHLVAEHGAVSAEAAAELRASGARFGVRLGDAVARLDLDVNASPDGLVVRPHGEALQQIAVETIGVGGRNFEHIVARAAPMTDETPLLEVAHGAVDLETRLRDLSGGAMAAGRRWAAVLPAAELAVSLAADGGRDVRVYVQAPRLETVLEGGEAVVQAGVLSSSLELEPDPHVSLRFTDLSIGGAGLPMGLEHAAGELDASLRDGLPFEGRATLTGAEVADHAELARLTPMVLSADAPIADGVLAGRLTAVASGGREIFHADLRQAFAAEEGELDVATPQFAFRPGGLQPSDVMPVLLGPMVNVDGRASAKMDLSWSPDGAAASAALDLDALTFDMRYGHVGGLTTRFEVADLFAFKSDGPQRIDIALIDPGLPFTDGQIDIELLGPTRVRLASARFPFADGEIIAAPAEIEWSSGQAHVLLIAQHISLEALDDMLDPPNLTVTGVLSGSLPIETRDRSVFVIDGELASEGPGLVSYAGRAGEGLARQNESAKLAFDALNNFHYDSLTLTLNGSLAGGEDAADELEASVHLEGRNPDLYEGYPIDFNLNTSVRFADLLNQAFRGVSLSAARVGATIEDDAGEDDAGEDDAGEVGAGEDGAASPP